MIVNIVMNHFTNCDSL